RGGAARTLLHAQALVVLEARRIVAKGVVGKVDSLRTRFRPWLRRALAAVRVQQRHEQVIVVLYGLRWRVLGRAQDLVMIRVAPEAHATHEVACRVLQLRDLGGRGRDRCRDLSLREAKHDAPVGQRLLAIGEPHARSYRVRMEGPEPQGYGGGV